VRLSTATVTAEYGFFYWIVSEISVLNFLKDLCSGLLAVGALAIGGNGNMLSRILLWTSVDLFSPRRKVTSVVHGEFLGRSGG
jgi:hypothetical protein